MRKEKNYSKKRCILCRSQNTQFQRKILLKSMEFHLCEPILGSMGKASKSKNSFEREHFILCVVKCVAN